MKTQEEIIKEIRRAEKVAKEEKEVVTAKMFTLGYVAGLKWTIKKGKDSEVGK